MTTDAQTALVSSWQGVMTRDKLSECLGLFIQRFESCVQDAGEEVDVGEPTVQPQSVPRHVEEQPVPTVRVGGSSGSGARSGVDSRASETNADDREAKRVRVAESRGQKRQGEDVRELVAKADEQHLDDDVEVGRCHKTWRVEDVVGDATDAAPQQMNSLASSKTEVFEKIEESL